MTDLEKYRAEQMKDPEFREYSEQMQPAADIAKAMVAARVRLGLTQKELANLVGFTQADISRLESCEGNPSLKRINQVARGLNMRLKIEFVPIDGGVEAED